ncbi:MAG: hypothetical protein COA58_12050 [Bacteroidetes bacterium]|nr:MAG: hypothetical protein COA58_12050 [Bacteroidota bacterium]
MRGISYVLFFISICCHAQLDSLSYFAGHSDDVTCIAFSPDGKYIVTGSWDQSIQIRSNDSFAWVVQQIDDFQGTINTIAFSRDGFRMIAGGQDGQLNFYEFNDSFFAVATLDTTLLINNSQINKLIYGPGMRTIFSAGDDGRFLTYDLAKDKVMQIRGNRPICAAAVAIDRRSFFIAAEGNATINQFDIFGKLVNSFVGHTNDITDLLVTVDRKYLVSSSKDRTVRIWAIANSKEEIKFEHHTWAVTDIDIDPFGQYLVSGGLDGTVNLYELKTRTKIKTYELPNYKINAVAISPNNTQIAVAAHLESTTDSSGFFTLNTGLPSRKIVLPKQFTVTKVKQKKGASKTTSNDKITKDVPPSKQTDSKPKKDQTVLKKTKQVKITIEDK